MTSTKTPETREARQARLAANRAKAAEKRAAKREAEYLRQAPLIAQAHARIGGLV